MGFARAKHDTGLASDYHAAFLIRAVVYRDRPLVPEALGPGTTGLDCWRHYRKLIEDLVRAAVSPATPQAAYGLAMLLERGVLHHAPIVPALGRLLQQRVQDQAGKMRVFFYNPNNDSGQDRGGGVLVSTSGAQPARRRWNWNSSCREFISSTKIRCAVTQAPKISRT